MDNLCIENKLFTFFDHRKLIDAANNVNSDENATNYSLRPELFDFRPKQNDKDHPSRKRKKPKRAMAQDAEDNALEALFSFTSRALKTELKFKIDSVPNLPSFPRYWEELTVGDFPKFKGANNTNAFQTVENLTANQSFLIPPQSRFYNYDISELTQCMPELCAPYDLIVLDPPWRNKYIRRLKRHQLGYGMLENKQLQELPIASLTNTTTVVAIWCTNSKLHQEALLQQILPSWRLRLLHVLKWLKLNTQLEPISPVKREDGASSFQKRPFELLYIACHQDAAPDFGLAIKNIDFISSVPSIIHSHKPPLLAWLQANNMLLDEQPRCLELFARYLQPHFTSWGLEVLKLMDKRLYYSHTDTKIDNKVS